MTTKTTRRGALATMAAAATVAVVPAYALTADPVIALAEKCKGVLAEYVEKPSRSAMRCTTRLWKRVNTCSIRPVAPWAVMNT